ncbi:hypothetical protein ANN_11215 [Periplaneta americana]|uniref:Transposase Tc1-like domain-containing protein n=1 Tax=Periplaneta americana TaxID=6978 RepID=A0ABQ8T6N2_PERAM|nr:hypothetical protein ANN_11215 [Periplaneta americana]
MQRHHLSSDYLEKVVRLEQRGEHLVDIADLRGTSQNVIYRVLPRFRETGLITRRPGSGSNCKTTPRQDRHIIIQARTPFSTAIYIQQDLQNATDLLVSDQTIKNRLWEEGLTSYRLLRCLALELIHHRQRLAWVNQKIEEGILWGNVLFTDEFRYCLFNGNRCHRVCRNISNE